MDFQEYSLTLISAGHYSKPFLSHSTHKSLAYKNIRKVNPTFEKVYIYSIYAKFVSNGSRVKKVTSRHALAHFEPNNRAIYSKPPTMFEILPGKMQTHRTTGRTKWTAQFQSQ